uniref:Si:dkey-85k15.4 n=1 Tax=Astyanax mexicanus TaxID=7994 RepID=A0A8B9H4N9_ASTMX
MKFIGFTESAYRKQIVQAENSLKWSDHTASAGLRSLDQNIEILTRDKRNLERDMRATQQTLQNLRTKRTSNETLLRKSRDALEVARSNLRSAKDTLQSQKRRQNTAAFVTGVGVGLFVVPVAGWIVDWYRNKVSFYKSKISKTEHNISQKHVKMQQIRTGIWNVKEQRAALADLQVKVRRAVHILSILSGRVSAVECQTQRFIVLETVMRVMEDVMKAAEEITGRQLLFNGGISRLLDVMRENNRRLAAICYSSNDAEDLLKDYY